MSTLRFAAIPLTPVHIGTGEPIAPEDYLIHEDRELVRFNPHAVLRDMEEAERRGYLETLERGDLTAAQRALRRACRPEVHALYRSALGEGSRGALRSLLQEDAAGGREARRRLEVHPFVRNRTSGNPVVPGSSLKGAIRTAIVNAFARQVPDLAERLAAERNRNRRWRVLEERAFGRRSAETERDALRMLRLADCELPGTAVRVDRATLIRRGERPGGSLEKVQIHVERLLARADGSEPVAPEIAIDLDTERASHPEVRALLGRRLDWAQLAAACNDFYLGRLQAELDHFFPPGSAVRGAVLAAWNGAAGGEAPRHPSGDEILLRIGRYSHFESLSVDRHREGWNVQKKRPIDDMGATRTLCPVGDGRGKTPFGWILLRCLDGPIAEAAARGTPRRLAPHVPRDPALDTHHRRAAEARVKREAERARAEAEARERAEAERRERERLARMSPEERAVAELESMLAEDRKAGAAQAGGRLADRVATLMREAPAWPPEPRERVAGLAEEIYDFIGWGSGKKKRERRTRIAALREPGGEQR